MGKSKLSFNKSDIKKIETSTLKPNSIGSSVLTKEENELLFSLFDENTYCNCAGVAKLYTFDLSNLSKLEYQDEGVICLTNKLLNKDDYMELYCLTRKRCIWKAQIPLNFLTTIYFENKAHDPDILKFNINNTNYALKFLCMPDAIKFYNICKLKFSVKQKEEKSSKELFTQNFQNVKESSKKNGKKHHCSGKDITLPFNCHHLLHLNYNPFTGYSTTAPSPHELDESGKAIVAATGYDPQTMLQTDIVLNKKHFFKLHS